MKPLSEGGEDFREQYDLQAYIIYQDSREMSFVGAVRADVYEAIQNAI